MSLLKVEQLWKAYVDQPILRGVDLDVPSGGVVALLGTSGSGKTTLLRVIAGFEPAQAGRITIGDRLLEAPGLHVPAERRHIGYVPQEGTLFPHLTVAGNIGFGLTRVERRRGRIEEVLRLTGLDELGRRYPNQLSGGQQQRTALARALAPRPDLVLLDEPFNALDLDLRRSVCADVIAALRAAGATAVLVTHDPQEAFASADLLAVMVEGRIAQVAAPAAVYHHPESPEIARLTGNTIFLDAEIGGGVARTVMGTLPVRPGGATLPQGAGLVMLRPEQVVPAPAGHGVPAAIIARSFRGDHMLVTAAVNGLTLDFRLADIEPLEATKPLSLAVVGACVAYAPASGA